MSTFRPAVLALTALVTATPALAATWHVGDGYTAPPVRILHLERNDWGTVDVDAIRALIQGGPCLQVEIEPLADGPVGAEPRTLGSVKALFR